MIQTVENIGEKLVSMLTYDASQPLIFSSGLFLFLFAGFLFFYGFTRRAPMARIVYVILFSLYFYYKSSGIYFLLLVFASVSDYWIAHAIYKVRTQRAKYWLVGLSVLVNLGMLGYFKYTNFLIEIANNLFGQGFLNFQNIFLPVGISFFVFQSMSYTIDICRGQLKPLNNWADYLFYLSFFPQLVAGPIVRAKDFIPQIRQNPLRVTREMFGMGVFLILIGLFKKAVISDYISLNFVDRIFDEPLLYSVNGVGAPWLLYGIGAVLALVLTYFKVPALAFALGMFIPLELNLPLLVGGAVNWYVTTRSKDEAVNAERGEKGTLLASGFIAGGALMGVVSAAMRFGGINLINEEWLSNPLSEVLSMAAYILLIIWLVKASMHIKKK